MTLQDVAVVGAGLAGLVCARRLQQAGYAVTVLEKSRGLGGRMATRRIDGSPLDHGARYVQPQSSQFQALTQHWLDQQLLTPWQPHTYRLDLIGQLHPNPLTAPCYVAPAGMSALGKALATGLTVHRQQRVTAIALESDTTWTITTTRTDDGTALTHDAKTLVLALPAPQIADLLAPLPEIEEIAEMKRAIAAVTYAPCLTVMAQYTSTSQAPAPLPCPPTEPWMVEGHVETPFFWVGLDSSKRQVPGLNVVLHSSDRFAEPWLDAPNLQPAGEALLAQAGKLIAPWLAHPDRWQIHRWRYARVETPGRDRILISSTPAPLVAGGDWGGDRQLDTALESGWAAAAAIQAHFSDNPLPDFPIGLF
ncbi:MAG: NAD(P)/FAD-dependent oxidoreductase [Leptolyngbyaceae cyanobacterium]